MSDFEFPWEYSFPPFFTIQVHEATREKQLEKWVNLIKDYQKHTNSSNLSIGDSGLLFQNQTINRQLPEDGRKIVLERMKKLGLAEPLDKDLSTWEVYWHTIPEWADILYNWAVENAKQNTVCTLFEITNDETQEFYKLDNAVLVKALRHLEKAGRCELINFGDSEGVKFY
ncbi:VPS25 family protein [Megaselia abdita]